MLICTFFISSYVQATSFGWCCRCFGGSILFTLSCCWWCVSLPPLRTDIFFRSFQVSCFGFLVVAYCYSNPTFLFGYRLGSPLILWLTKFCFSSESIIKVISSSYFSKVLNAYIKRVQKLRILVGSWVQVTRPLFYWTSLLTVTCVIIQIYVQSYFVVWWTWFDMLFVPSVAFIRDPNRGKILFHLWKFIGRILSFSYPFMTWFTWLRDASIGPLLHLADFLWFSGKCLTV